ncbi:response regulator [archaeon]|jgi:CheY-like chemotaxis protein|nr:response regulator [archaeon]MBT4397208.1 response regulator [archaeon]MBT4440588.1 response regulator [archaeon]
MSRDIIAADDEKVFRGVMQEQLVERGFNVILASCATEADELYREHKPFGVVTDMNMPDATGLDLARQIVSYNDPTKPRIVVASGDFEGMVPVMEEAVSDGIVNAYGNKRELPHLIDRLNRYNGVLLVEPNEQYGETIQAHARRTRGLEIVVVPGRDEAIAELARTEVEGVRIRALITREGHFSISNIFASRKIPVFHHSFPGLIDTEGTPEDIVNCFRKDRYTPSSQQERRPLGSYELVRLGSAAGMV